MLRDRDKQLSLYYDMGSSYGKPTPLVLLPFAEMLTAKTDNSLLWWVAGAGGWLSVVVHATTA
jgi:hypothetical protein